MIKSFATGKIGAAALPADLLLTLLAASIKICTTKHTN